MSSRHSFLSTTGLLRSPSSASAVPSVHSYITPPNRTKEPKKSKRSLKPNFAALRQKLHTHAGVVPLGPTFVVFMVIVLSLAFIGAISFAFVGFEIGSSFDSVLDDIAKNSPGIVLVGDNVDIDVDEPSITIRWSILGCGTNYVLPGSEGTHGSSLCGIPSMALNVYVDGEDQPTAMYDPADIPYTSGSGKRTSIQNLFQFDSDHVLDVHLARLYPFDTYHLSSTVHVTNNATGQPVPLARLPTIIETPSFLVTSADISSYVNVTNTDSDEPQQFPGRDLDMQVKRPAEARAYSLLLFTLNWMLAHACIAYVVLVFKLPETDRILKYLAFVAATLVIMPQVRNTMPDGPGFDGFLIDSIGFFPQMLVSGVCLIIILAVIARRELHALDNEDEDIESSTAASGQTKESSINTAKANLPRKLKLKGSTSGASMDFGHVRAFSRSFNRPARPSPIVETF